MTRPIVVQGPHPWLYAGVRLAPGYAQAAFRVPTSDLTDQSVDYHAHVGLTPKMLARVMRARAALGRAAAARMAHPRNVNLGAIAYELGYYDQPHFIDDIKEITGQTPGEWLG